MNNENNSYKHKIIKRLYNYGNYIELIPKYKVLTCMH